MPTKISRPAVRLAQNLEEEVPLSPLEEQVFDSALAALTLPLAARLLWFHTLAQAIEATNHALGWNGKANQIN